MYLRECVLLTESTPKQQLSEQRQEISIILCHLFHGHIQNFTAVGVRAMVLSCCCQSLTPKLLAICHQNSLVDEKPLTCGVNPIWWSFLRNRKPWHQLLTFGTCKKKYPNIHSTEKGLSTGQMWDVVKAKQHLWFIRNQCGPNALHHSSV